MYSLIQLECFVAVAEELHFGAAAERLGMTQPPLSRQIQLLERELETRLFTRTSRSVQLTAAGRSLLPDALRILDLVAASAVDVRRVASGAAGTLTIAYTATAAQSALPRLLRAADAHMPGVTLVLRELVSADQLDELSRGTVDLGLLRPISARPGIRIRSIMTERMIAAVPADHRIAALPGPVPIAALASERLLAYAPAEARYFHDLVLSLFAAAGATPTVAQYASQVPALLALVQAGLGVALLPESARRFAPEGVVFRNLENGPPLDTLNRVGLSAAWNDGNGNPALGPALDLLADLDPAR
jgi:DNA-binding transcriptional LysR family regulator